MPLKNYDLPELVKRMDSGLAEIEKHFNAWKIKLNSAKTETILFSKSSKMKKKVKTLTELQSTNKNSTGKAQ